MKVRKYELKQRTGFLIRDIKWLMGKAEFKTRRDASYLLERATEMQRDIDARWYHKLMWWMSEKP